VVLGKARKIQRWDLRVYKRLAEEDLPVKGPVRGMAMGAGAKGGFLLLSSTEGSDPSQPLHLHLLEVATLQVPDVPGFGPGAEEGLTKKELAVKLQFKDKIQMRASQDGRTFGVWSNSRQDALVHLTIVRENSLNTMSIQSDLGHVTPSADGKFIGSAR